LDHRSLGAHSKFFQLLHIFNIVLEKQKKNIIKNKGESVVVSYVKKNSF